MAINNSAIFQQPSLDLGDREIHLPGWTKTERMGCGIIEQTLLEEGTYPVTSVCEKTKVSSELDLKGCHFERVLARQSAIRGPKSEWPIALTDDLTTESIQVRSLKISDDEIEAISADSVRESWIDALQLRTEIPGGKAGFRNAQVGAIHAVLAHWSVSNLPCSVVLPTGTGKTETMLGVTVSDRAKLVMVVVPSDELRSQISGKFRSLGILKEINVLKDRAVLPRVATLKHRPKNMGDVDRLLACNVIVTTPMLLDCDKKFLSKLVETVSHVFFDEAHHLKAASWSRIKTAFSCSKIVQFTATPYRRDRQPLEGKVVYQYSLEMAQKDGCFSEISLITVDERNPAKKDLAIADAALQRLEEDRKGGYPNHCMMVRAENKVRAKRLFDLYQSRFPAESIALVYSGVPGKRGLIERIKKGEFSIVVCVDMLKEGFDYPEFKIAAVHDLHKSLAVAMQFIGRFTRDRKDLGRAHMVINYAEANIPRELEKLYAEGSGWSEVISEVAQSKQQEAIEFIEFLSHCQPYRSFDEPEQIHSPRLVNPALSCVVYRCSGSVDWSRFPEAFAKKYRFSQPYENSKWNLFYFSAQARERVKWTKSEAIKDQLWTLVMMHYSPEQGLLYIGCSDTKFKHENLAKAVCRGDHSLIKLNPVFRCFQNIKRLKIIHAGLLKPANRNHRYSKYSGADVTTELANLASGGRTRKSDFVGIGYRDGNPVGVGASQKGKVWNPARVGDPLKWIEWCEMTGAMLIDENIDPDQILKDTAKVKEIEEFPTSQNIIAMDWNEETFEKYHRMSLVESNGSRTPLYLCEFTDWSWTANELRFAIAREGKPPIKFVLKLETEDGHVVAILDGKRVEIEGWSRDLKPAEEFFLDFPPTVFLADGSLISGCQHTDFQAPDETLLPDDFLMSWNWDGVDIKTEAAYKSEAGAIHFRADSVQEKVLQFCRDEGASLVFNDDGAGESADVVAIEEDDDLVTIKLLHCKFSKGRTAGHRVGDLYEVCGQAVKSVKWKWEPKALLKHLKNRANSGIGRDRRFFHGDELTLSNLLNKLEYGDVRFEFWIVQPGLDPKGIPPDLVSLLKSTSASIADMTECQLRVVSS
ncbi:MAG: DEAD/DEAH box helicase family protein [Verrucomicrobiales bacterium]